MAVWAEWNRRVEGDQSRPYFAYVRNAGDAPVYVDHLLAHAARGDPQKCEFGLVAPQDTRGVGLNQDRFPPDEDPPYVEVFFRDAEERAWWRDSRGYLRSSDWEAIGSPTAEAIDANEPSIGNRGRLDSLVSKRQKPTKDRTRLTTLR